MIPRRQLSKWLLFAFSAFIFCVILSFRPIPSINESNDTGRYIESLHQYCTSYGVDRAENKELSYGIFYGATSIACFAESDGVFLFLVAAFVPLVFLLFVRWRSDTYLWAFSLIFSVAGIELMTNALRQNFAMFLFFGALSLSIKYRIIAIALVLLASIAHSSILYYLPLFFWMITSKKSKKFLIATLATLVLFIFAFNAYTVSLLDEIVELNTFYSTIYEEALSLSFTAFMSLPVFLIYGARYYFMKECISIEEKTAAFYSIALLIICFFAFPAILYRFAMLASELQIFLSARSPQLSKKAGLYVLIGLVLHLSVMVIFSNNYKVLYNG